MKKFIIALFISFLLNVSGSFAEENTSGLNFSSLTQENLKNCSQIISGGVKTQCYNKIFETFGEKDKKQCLSILAPGKLRNILPRGNLTTDEYFNLQNSTSQLIQSYCSDKYTQIKVHLTPTQRQEQDYTYAENKLYDQYKAKPYGCIQKIDFEGPGAYYATINRQTTYQNVCKNGMTDEEHEKAVKEFVPYLNNPSLFYDYPELWKKFRSDIISIKTTNNGTIDEEIDNLIIGLKKYKNKFIKNDVSDKSLKEFFLKKAKEIDPVEEKKKQQAMKQKAVQEKRKQDKLVKDTIAPFVQCINPRYNQYLYNIMQEHYLKSLSEVNDPSQSYYDTLSERQNALLATASEFADYILINGTIDPELVVKKGQEDNLREAILEDVVKRYNIQ